MHFTVCLVCGRSRCRCGGGPGNKVWRAPVATMRDALRTHVSSKATLVFGPEEDFDTIWGGDPDWDLSLEVVSGL